MNLRSNCLALVLAVVVGVPARAAAASPAEASRAEVDRQRKSTPPPTKAKPRRNLTPAAIIVGTVAGCTFLGGILLYSMTPRPFLQPTAYRQYRRDQAGIALMAIGGALVIPAIVLGVLAHRQEREERAARNAAVLSLAPHVGPRGGGAGLQLRF